MRRLKSLKTSLHWSHGELQTKGMAAWSRKADMRELKQGCWPGSVGHHTATAAPVSWTQANSSRTEHHTTRHNICDASTSMSSTALAYWAKERGVAQVSTGKRPRQEDEVKGEGRSFVRVEDKRKETGRA